MENPDGFSTLFQVLESFSKRQKQFKNETFITIGKQDGYIQTKKHGGVWHTKNDNLEFLKREFPGRVQEHLTHFTEILTELLYDIKKMKKNHNPSQSKPLPGIIFFGPMKLIGPFSLVHIKG